MPALDGMVDAWVALCTSEAVTAHAANYPAHANEYGPFFRAILDSGTRVTSRQLQDAKQIRATLTVRLNTLLESLDAMVCPAGGDPAWPITHELQVGPLQAYLEAWSAVAPRASEFTVPMDIAGTPALCLPSGFSKDGLPYSIQFAGRRLSEPMLCRSGHAYEQSTIWHARHPDLDAI
jgi:amidase